MSSSFVSCVRDNSPRLKYDLAAKDGAKVSNSNTLPPPSKQVSMPEFQDMINVEHQKKRRFHPLRNLRRIFRRRTITSASEADTTHDLGSPSASSSEKNLRANRSLVTSLTSNSDEQRQQATTSYPAPGFPQHQANENLMIKSLPKSKSYGSTAVTLKKHDAIVAERRTGNMFTDTDDKKMTNMLRKDSELQPSSYAGRGTAAGLGAGAGAGVGSVAVLPTGKYKMPTEKSSASGSGGGVKSSYRHSMNYNVDAPSDKGGHIKESQRSLGDARLLDRSDYGREVLSLSHDSVFSELETPSSLSIVLKAELSDALRKRRNRAEASTEDLASATSPTSPTKAMEKFEAKSKYSGNPKSKAPPSHGLMTSFSLSYVNPPSTSQQAEPETGQSRQQTWNSNGVDDIDCVKDERFQLSHAAAKHKMAIRPNKKKMPSRLQRRTIEITTTMQDRELATVSSEAPTKEEPSARKRSTVPSQAPSKMLNEDPEHIKTSVTKPPTTPHKKDLSLGLVSSTESFKHSHFGSPTKHDVKKLFSPTKREDVTGGLSSPTKKQEASGPFKYTGYSPTKKQEVVGLFSSTEVLKHINSTPTKKKEATSPMSPTEAFKHTNLSSTKKQDMTGGLSSPLEAFKLTKSKSTLVQTSAGSSSDIEAFQKNPILSPTKKPLGFVYKKHGHVQLTKDEPQVIKIEQETPFVRSSKRTISISNAEDSDVLPKDPKKILLSGSAGKYDEKRKSDELKPNNISSILNTFNAIECEKETSMKRFPEPMETPRYVLQEIINEKHEAARHKLFKTNELMETKKPITSSLKSTTNYYEKKAKIIGLSPFQQKIARSSDSLGPQASDSSSHSSNNSMETSTDCPLDYYEEKKRHHVEKSKSFRALPGVDGSSKHIKNMPSLPDLTLNIRIPETAAYHLDNEEKCLSLGFEINDNNLFKVQPERESKQNHKTNNIIVAAGLKPELISPKLAETDVDKDMCEIEDNIDKIVKMPINLKTSKVSEKRALAADHPSAAAHETFRKPVPVAAAGQSLSSPNVPEFLKIQLNRIDPERLARPTLVLSTNNINSNRESPKNEEPSSPVLVSPKAELKVDKFAAEVRTPATDKIKKPFDFKKRQDKDEEEPLVSSKPLKYSIATTQIPKTKPPSFSLKPTAKTADKPVGKLSNDHSSSYIVGSTIDINTVRINEDPKLCLARPDGDKKKPEQPKLWDQGKKPSAEEKEETPSVETVVGKVSLQQRRRMFMASTESNTKVSVELPDEQKLAKSNDSAKSSASSSPTTPTGRSLARTPPAYENDPTTESTANQNIVLRKKPSVSGGGGTTSDGTPELMKVFARRSLKLKDDDIVTLQGKINGESKEATAAATQTQNVDSDKENHSASEEKLDKLANDNANNNNNNSNSNHNNISSSISSDNNNNNNNNSAVQTSNPRQNVGVFRAAFNKFGTNNSANLPATTSVKPFSKSNTQSHSYPSKEKSPTAPSSLKGSPVFELNNNNNNINIGLTNSNNCKLEAKLLTSLNVDGQPENLKNQEMLEPLAASKKADESSASSSSSSSTSSTCLSEFKAIQQRRAEWEQRAKEALK